jgi:hypothetical protein
MKPVFLSASIPNRAPYIGTFDPYLIREAILALVSVVTQETDLVFGGHPAISPLVEHAAATLGTKDRVYIFQSEFFRGALPPEALRFNNLRWVGTGPDRESSLLAMRQEMIGFRDFGAAVFVGGMEGVHAERFIFDTMRPQADLFPIASTGAAAEELLVLGYGPRSQALRLELSTEFRYKDLFRRILK